MNVVVVGINHVDTPLEVMEQATFTKRMAREALLILKGSEAIEEVVILSTCNRSEIYAFSHAPEEAANILEHFYTEVKSKALAPYLFRYINRKALQHLYQVVTGLDSMILGEDQILGQVKNALEVSQLQGTCGKYGAKIFREAITFSKKVRTEYKISETSLSLGSTAVKYLKKTHPYYADEKVLIIGTGEMGTLTLRHLAAEGFGHIAMTNRTLHPTDGYQPLFEGLNVHPYTSRYDLIAEMDVVICATASPHSVLRLEEMRPRTKPLTIIDLALPRDVDPDIGDMDGVELIAIDDFNHLIDDALDYRKEIAAKIAEIIDRELDELIDWISKSKVDHLVRFFNQSACTLAEETIQALNERFAFEGKDRSYLEKVVKAKFRQMVMPSIRNLKALESDEAIGDVEKAMGLLFVDHREGHDL